MEIEPREAQFLKAPTETIIFLEPRLTMESSAQPSNAVEREIDSSEYSNETRTNFVLENNLLPKYLILAGMTFVISGSVLSNVKEINPELQNVSL